MCVPHCHLHTKEEWKEGQKKIKQACFCLDWRKCITLIALFKLKLLFNISHDAEEEEKKGNDEKEEELAIVRYNAGGFFF